MVSIRERGSGMEIGLFSGLLWVIGTVVVFTLLDRLNNRWFAIDVKVLQSEAAKKINRWSSFALVIALIVFLFFRKQLQGEYEYILELAAVVTVIFGIQSYFEWKLLKGSKKYQMTLVTLGLVFLVLFFAMILL